MKKYLITICALLVLAAVLVACGGQPAATTESPAAAEVTEAPTVVVATEVPAQPEVSGDPVLGGKLYDNWIKTLGVDAPEGDQPLWATQTSNTRSGKDTWRCKECHGWDYLGVDGRYASGSHQTGFAGIYSAKDKSSEELLATLMGENHDFSAFLGDGEIAALVAFIQQVQDTTPYINSDKTINGDEAKGKSLYDSTCAVCHGEDGRSIDFDDGEEKEFVGTLALDNPWEIIHKVAYGQPGAEGMPAGIDLGWSWLDFADILKYLQTLPTE